MQGSLLLRIVVGGVAAVMLLVPSLVFAYAWSATLNLEVATAATGVTIVSAIWLPRFRWVGAVLAALVIAVPPYPYWTSWDESRGQYLHFFHGFSLQNVPLLTFAAIFCVALLMFAVIFWAIGGRRKAAKT